MVSILCEKLCVYKSSLKNTNFSQSLVNNDLSVEIDLLFNT